jgi:hypothetical protein
MSQPRLRHAAELLGETECSIKSMGAAAGCWQQQPPLPWPSSTFLDRQMPRASSASGHAQGGGIGHNLPQEAPQAFASAIIDVSRL